MDEVLLLVFIMMIVHDWIMLVPLERRVKTLEEALKKEGTNDER